MIVLTEIATKLQNILNGIDLETIAIQRPVDYEFLVATQGFHLDKISNKTTGNNFIPVFISSMGGEYNPIPNLKQANYNIPITIYFPVRFKDNFFRLNDFLIDCFVGTYLNYGTFSGKCISNISVAQYGEIVDLDLKEFQSWITNIYQIEKEIREPFMSMNFTLYLSTANSEFVFGNSVNVKLGMTHLESNLFINNHLFVRNPELDEEGQNQFEGSQYYETAYAFTYQGVTYYTDDDLGVEGSDYYIRKSAHDYRIVDELTAENCQFNSFNSILEDNNVTLDTRTIQSQSDMAAQQLLGATIPESEGLPVSTSYSSGFSIYYKENYIYEYLIDQWFKGKSQSIDFILTMSFNGHEFKRNVYLQSCNLIAINGKPITLTFAFAKKVTE